MSASVPAFISLAAVSADLRWCACHHRMKGSQVGVKLQPTRRDAIAFRISIALPRFSRRDGRVAEGARLESVFTRKGNVGSNPTLSAILGNNGLNCPARIAG